MDFLKKAIKDKAEKRLDDIRKSACKAIDQNELLSGLRFEMKRGETRYLKDLIRYEDFTQETFKNFDELEERLLEKFEKEETQEILSAVKSLKDFIDEREA